MTSGGSERRLVSVLFADLTGFTSVAEAMDPEDVHAFLGPMMAELGDVVAGHGGTVTSWQGDGLLAVFGVPVAHADDAERAVRAALACRDAVRRRRDQTPGWTGPSDLHAGVNAGEVLVVPTPAGFDVIGDTVNTASRLVGVAPGGCVLVGERVRDLTSHAVTYLEWAPIRLKGKALPIQAFQATGVTAPPAGRGPTAGRTPFVGREGELAALQARLERVQTEQRSEAVVVAGPPGVGKSRLVARFGEVAEGTVVVGRCQPYGERAPWHALAGVVADLAGVAPADDADARVAKLERTVAGALPGAPAGERASVADGLAAMLGLEPAPAGSGAVELNLDLAVAVRRLLEGMARGGPLILVLEDLQWADPQLLAFVRWVVEEPWPVPVLFVGVSWPEAVSAGAVKVDPSDVIPVGTLDEANAEAMVRALLPGEIPPGLARELLARSGGNPLYLEETVRLLRERKALVQEAQRWTLAGRLDDAIPASLHLVVAARLDGLPERERRLIRDAATAGTRFPPEMLRALGWGSDVDDLLRDLADRDLLRADPGPDAGGPTGYFFKHAVIRDVAYASLPRAERAEKHLAIAAWLRRTAASPEEEPVDLLAHHYVQAAELREDRSGTAFLAALVYLKRAAERAARQQAHLETVALADEALRLIGAEEPAGAGEEAEALVGILVAYVSALTSLTRYPEAQPAAQRVLEIGRRSDRPDWEAAALVGLARIASDWGDVGEARSLLERAGEVFRELGDEIGLATVLFEASYAARLDDVAEQRRLLEEAAERFARIGDAWRELRCVQTLAWIDTPRGGEDFARWYERLESLTERAGDLRSRGALRSVWGFSRLYAGDLGEAQAALEEAAAIGAEVGDPDLEVEGLFPRGQVALQLGANDDAARFGERLRDIGRDRRWARTEAQGALLVGRVEARRGHPDRSQEALAEAESLLSGIAYERELSEVWLARAETSLERGLLDEAMAFADRFVEDSRRFGDRLMVPYGLLLRGLGLLASGASGDADVALTEASDEAKAVGNVLVPAHAHAALTPISGAGAERQDEDASELATPMELAFRAEARARAGQDPDAAWGESIQAWLELGTTFWLARTMAGYANWLASTGQADRAAHLRQRGQAVLDLLDADLDLNDLRPRRS